MRRLPPNRENPFPIAIYIYIGRSYNCKTDKLERRPNSVFLFVNKQNLEILLKETLPYLLQYLFSNSCGVSWVTINPVKFVCLIFSFLFFRVSQKQSSQAKHNYLKTTLKRRPEK